MYPYEKLKNGEWNLGYLSGNPELLQLIITNNFDTDSLVKVRLVDNRLIEAKIVYYNVSDNIFCIENKT